MAIVPVNGVVVPRQRSGPTFLIPLCFCCILLFLVAAGIVLGVIPAYLPRDHRNNNRRTVDFTTTLNVRNGSFPVGALSNDNCQRIQTLLRQLARSNPNVNPVVPTVTSCTVSQGTTGRRKRQTQGTVINIVGFMTGARSCISLSCVSSHTATFLTYLISLNDFILTLLSPNGTPVTLAVGFGTSTVNGVTIETSQPVQPIPPVTNPDTIFYGLNSQNQLLRINSSNPSNLLSTVTVTGMDNGEMLLTIDFRPGIGQLYGITNASQIYVINQNTGVARLIGCGFSPYVNSSTISMDFNPLTDRITLVAVEGQNLQLNPVTGSVDGTTNATTIGATLSVIAYDTNRGGTHTTNLFNIDPTSDSLSQYGQPNGSYTLVGSSLNVPFTLPIGFDISPEGSALVSSVVNGVSQLYALNLVNGTAALNLGNLPQTLIALAIPTDPIAYTTLGQDEELVAFNPFNLNIDPIPRKVHGLMSGERIVGIDFRPSTGQLYALGDANNIYTLDLGTAVATRLPANVSFTPPLSGSPFSFGFDFNPETDRIRVVSNLGQNLRVNPDTGTLTAQDGNLNPNSPNVTAAAYSNNIDGATSTVLYVLDTGSDRLLIENPAANGTLVDVGPLGIDVLGMNGFDIGGTSNIAYALLTINGIGGPNPGIYRIDLNTGAATLTGGRFPLTGNSFALGLGF